MTTKRDQLAALRSNALDRKGEVEQPTESASPPPVPTTTKPDGAAKKPGRKRAKSRTTPRTATTVPSATESGLPPLVRRDQLAGDEEMQRMGIDVSSDCEPFRKQAQDAGIDKTHLLLSALELHGEQLRQEAANGGVLLPYKGATSAKTRWVLIMTPNEYQRVVDFIDDVGQAMPRKKNATVLTLLIARAAGLTSKN